jgi:hypothetical protein
VFTYFIKYPPSPIPRVPFGFVDMENGMPLKINHITKTIKSVEFFIHFSKKTNFTAKLVHGSHLWAL